MDKIGQIIIAFLQSFIMFFAPIQGLLIAVGIAIFADTYFGVKLANKNGEYRTSILRKGFVGKLITYHLSIISFYVIDFYLLNEWMIHHISIDTALTKLLAIAFVYIEASSINETSEKLYEKSFYEKFCEILRKLKKLRKDLSDGE